MQYAITLLIPLSVATLALVWQIHMAEKNERHDKDKDKDEKPKGEKPPSGTSWPADKENKETLDVSNGVTKNGKPFIILLKGLEHGGQRAIQLQVEVS